MSFFAFQSQHLVNQIKDIFTNFNGVNNIGLEKLHKKSI